MLLNSVKRAFALNSFLLFTETWLLNFGRSWTDIYWTFLNVSLPLFCLRIKIKNVFAWLESEVISINLNSIDLFWIDELIHIVYSKFKLQMFWKILTFIVFNIWNLNRMYIKLTCVYHWISNCKYFPYKTKSSNCYSINLFKSVFRIAILIKAFYIYT